MELQYITYEEILDGSVGRGDPHALDAFGTRTTVEDQLTDEERILDLRCNEVDLGLLLLRKVDTTDDGVDPVELLTYHLQGVDDASLCGSGDADNLIDLPTRVGLFFML